MRKFENFLKRKTEGIKDKIIFIDLAYAETTRGTLEIHFGIKTKVSGLIGMSWNTLITDVEDDFTIKEFKETCEKFNIQNSVFSGDIETYGLK